MRHANDRWSDASDAKLFHLRDEKGWHWAAIDEEIGRMPGASAFRYYRLRQRRKAAGKPISPGKIMQEPISLPPPKSLTAAIFGDPLPGRSALDRKRENA